MLPSGFNAAVSAVLNEGFVDEHTFGIDVADGIEQMHVDGFALLSPYSSMGKGVTTRTVEDNRRNFLVNQIWASIFPASSALLILTVVRIRVIT